MTQLEAHLLYYIKPCNANFHFLPLFTCIQAKNVSELLVQTVKIIEITKTTKFTSNRQAARGAFSEVDKTPQEAPLAAWRVP